MPLKALIFDFDGLILDTETPEVVSWDEIYAEYGVKFPIAEWINVVGGNGANHFNPLDYLESRSGKKLDRQAVTDRRRIRDHELIAANDVLPGVNELLREAVSLGLRVGIASSSPLDWVDTHLRRLGMLDAFESITNADDVSRVKPSPELFQLALKRLDVKPEEAIVFEDSYNGVLAARRAGIFCIACPNSVTANMPLGDADLVVDSLLEISLRDLVKIF